MAVLRVGGIRLGADGAQIRSNIEAVRRRTMAGKRPRRGVLVRERSNGIRQKRLHAGDGIRQTRLVSHVVTGIDNAVVELPVKKCRLGAIAEPLVPSVSQIGRDA